MVSYQWAQQALFQWTRIDMLLALLEETLRVLQSLQQHTQTGKITTVERETDRLWQRGRLLVGALLSGVNPQVGETGRLCLRLYEFVLHVLEQKRLDSLSGAIEVLRTLQEAFQAVRAEAIALERNGEIPSLDNVGLDSGVLV